MEEIIANAYFNHSRMTQNKKFMMCFRLFERIISSNIIKEDSLVLFWNNIVSLKLF